MPRPGHSHVVRDLSAVANASFAKARDLSTDPKPSSIRLALALVTEALTIKPKQSKWYLLRALLYRRVGEFQLALYDQNAAIRLDKDNPAAYCGRGLCLRKLGRPRDALTDFNAAVSLGGDKGGDKYRFYRGLLLVDLQQWDNAAEDFAASAGGDTRYEV